MAESKFKNLQEDVCFKDPEEEVLEEFQSRARTASANIDDDV